MSERQPRFDADLYTDAAIVDPYPLYRAIRELGPAVWLTAHQAWAVGRFSDVRAALRADDILVSGRGVALNDLVNSSVLRVSLTTDGDVHRRLRTALMKPMMPSALGEVRIEIQKLAEELVTRLVERPSFDGIADFAQQLPLAVVSRLVGLPESGRQRMREWAAATFDALGVMNERAQRAVPLVLELAAYTSSLARNQLDPRGWAALLFAAVDEGRLEAEDISGILFDYIAPSLDTTILGTGHLLFQLGRHPEQWDLVRRDPSWIPRAIQEALRLESPIRAFSRFAAQDYDAGGTVIPAGDRVLILYGSANRDERRYPDPDRFDITRDAKDHVAFGHGVHRCAGSYLAELEMESLLRAMAARVARIEIGEPETAMNNILRGYRGFEVSFRGQEPGVGSQGR